MGKLIRLKTVVFFISILQLIQFVILRHRLLSRLIAIILISTIVVFLFINDFYSNRQIYFLYKDQSSCSIDLYSIIKVLKIVNWGFWFLFLANMITWFHYDELDQDRIQLLPIDFKKLTFSTCVVHLIFFTIAASIFLLEVWNAWDYLEINFEWSNSPFTKTQVYLSFLFNSIYWSLLCCLVIFIKTFIGRSNKIIFMGTLLLALWISYNIAPINLVIRGLSKQC
jgi:hypothetical protein